VRRAPSCRKISESPSRFSPTGSSLLAKATSLPSCDTAGAGPRERESSDAGTGSPAALVALVSIATTRKPAGVKPALDSKTTREPSPLRVGFMLTDSCAVVVRRLGAFDCERTPKTSKKKMVAEMRTTARRLAREATAVLLSYEEGRTAWRLRSRVNALSAD
jgi:hypothetical protein